MLIKEKERELEQRGGAALRILPLRQSCRDYGQIRLLSCRRAAEVREWPRTQGHESAERRFGPEVKINVQIANGVMVGGILDWIGRIDGQIVIRDFKSGDVYDEEGDIKEDYQLQLPIYAWLYHAKFGEWADRLELWPRHGDPVEVPYSTAEADRMVRAKLDEVESTNARIQAADKAPRGLAMPSAEVCRSCLWRAFCDAYWANQEAANERDFQGTLDKVEQGSFGSKTCVFRGPDGSSIVLRNVTSAIWDNAEASLGKHFRVTGALNEKAANHFRASQSIVLYASESSA